MITKIKNFRFILGITLIFGLLVFLFGFYNIAFSEGGEECDPNDPTLDCNRPGTPPPLTGSGGTPTYVNENWVDVSISVPYPNAQIPSGETFDVSWSADWNTAEVADGRIVYTVTLFKEGEVLKTWSVDSESGQQRPEGGSFTVNGGVSQDTEFSVFAEVLGYYSGRRDVDTASVLVTNPSTNCKINSFSADNQTVPYGSTTNLRFSLDGNYSWSIKVLGGNEIATGNNNGSVVNTGPITGAKTFRLTCDNTTIRDITVGNPPPSPPGPNGGGGWCGPENSEPYGPRIDVPSGYVLLGTEWIGDYSSEPGKAGVAGAVFDFSRGVSVPPQTNYIVATINMDDGGSVSINGSKVYEVAPTCSIKNNQIEVSMPAGQSSTIDVSAINSGLGGVGADIDFFFYRIPGGEDLTPSINAPSCSDTSYTATISWAPKNVGIRIFIDDNFNTPDGFNKLMSGSVGETTAPGGFTQRIPGAPQILVLEPGITYYSFIQNESTGDKDGSTVSWVVNRCDGQTNGSISASPNPCYINANSSTCNTSLSWNTINPVGTSAITKVPNSIVATGNSSSGQSVAVGYGGERFFLYNNSKELGSVFVNSLCAVNTSWDSISGKCESGGGNGNFCPDGSLPPCGNGGGGSQCTNGATNYPACTLGSGGSCVNGAVNPPACTLGQGGGCVNGTNNPPECNYSGQTRLLKINQSNKGTVSSSDGKINCGYLNNSCQHYYPLGEDVLLGVKSNSGYWKFSSWSTEPSGLCSDGSISCNVDMSQNITITPRFIPRIFDYREF